MEAIITWDENILLWIQNNIRNDSLTDFITFITNLGNGGAIWIVLAVLLLLLPKYRKVGIACGISMTATFLVVNLGLKNFVARTRPYEVIAGLSRLIPSPGDFSFPSGHASHAFAASVVILLMMNKKVGVPIFCLAILISLSRLYVGVHYPTDVICGALIGALSAYASVRLVNSIVNAIAKDLLDKKQALF